MTASTGNRPLRAMTALAFAGAVLLLPVTSAPARAQDDPNKVVATVDGAPIMLSDLALAARDMQQELAQLPPQQRMQAVIDSLIDIKLFEKAAVTAGIDKNEPVQKYLTLLRARALRNEYLLDKVSKVVTDEAIKKRYEDEAAKFVPEDELHLYHILVKTEDEAKGIIAELDKGGDFEKLATEKSGDPGSGAGGGDLGFISRGKTVQPFEDAAFKLDVGAYTKAPVQTQFGWHVIKLTEKRKQTAPGFEMRASAIRQEMLTDFLKKETAAVREGAKIVIIEEKPAAAENPADPAATPADPATTPAEPTPAQ